MTSLNHDDIDRWLSQREDAKLQQKQTVAPQPTIHHWTHGLVPSTSLIPPGARMIKSPFYERTEREAQAAKEKEKAAKAQVQAVIKQQKEVGLTKLHYENGMREDQEFRQYCMEEEPEFYAWLEEKDPNWRLSWIETEGRDWMMENDEEYREWMEDMFMDPDFYCAPDTSNMCRSCSTDFDPDCPACLDCLEGKNDWTSPRETEALMPVSSIPTCW